MVMSEALKYVSTSALSLTLSGNTGVAPFLTLFLVGIIERFDPTLLHMDGWVEKILASWPGIAIFGALTVLEFVAKCVPVVDEIVDSFEVMLVPIFSVLGSLASHGLYTAPDSDEGGRRLEGDDDGGANGLVIALQVVLSAVGIGLALLVHLCKMLVRLLGEGCCTPCITALEIGWVAVSVTVCIYIVPIAIGAAALLLVAAGFGFRSWWRKRQEKRAEAEAEEEAAGGAGGAGGAGVADEAGTGAAVGSDEGDDKLEPLLP